jgi:hypothetical protein
VAEAGNKVPHWVHASEVVAAVACHTFVDKDFVHPILENSAVSVIPIER